MSFISLRADPISMALHAPLVIVLPVYNETATVRTVVAEWTEALEKLRVNHQFVLLNDGSTDTTLGALREMEARSPARMVVVDKPNAGHGRTCRLGYEAAVASPAVEWVLQIDSDGQCDPSYFEMFWSQREDADCIFGKRVRRDDGIGRTITSKLCKWSASLLCRQNMADPNVPYRLLRRPVLERALARIPASFNIHNVALTFVLRKFPDVRWKVVPIRFRERQGGDNSINILNVAHWGIDMLLELRKLK